MIHAHTALARDSIKVAIRACSLRTGLLISLPWGTVSPAPAQSAKPTSRPTPERGKLPFARDCACHSRDAAGGESGPELTRSQSNTAIGNMKSLSTKKILCAAAVLFFFPGRLLSQGLDPSIIANPPADSWPSYHGDYSGRRHSRLTRVTPQNVASLALAWAFQTGQSATIKSSPLLVDGVLYFTVPDNVWAVDARTGHMLWHYSRVATQGEHIG